MAIPRKNFLDALSEGDHECIMGIYESTFPKVLKFVLNNHGQKADAYDVFQKALMQIIVRYRTREFAITSSFDAFLFTACKNLWRRELNRRKKKVTNKRVLELESDEKDMALALLEQERWELFNEKMEELSTNCKTILKLFFNKVPYADIAAEMGYNSDNVLRQRIFKCKSKLSQLIKKDARFLKLKEV